jgi:HEAT repeat protein
MALRSGAAALLVFVLGGEAAADGLADVRAVLRSRGPLDERGAPELVGGLAALGVEAIPLLHGLVRGAEQGELVGAEWRPDEWRCSPEEIPELCARALERFPPKELLRHLEQALDESAGIEEQLVLLRLLGGAGVVEALPLLFECATKVGDPTLRRPRVAHALREAFARVLTEDPRAWAWLEARSREIDPAVAGALVDAIGATGRARGAGLLAAWFGAGRFDPARIADALAALEHARPWELEGTTLRTTALWWRSQDPAERTQAARLAGELGGLERVSELIAFLEDSEAPVRRTAHQALERLAGVPMRGDVEAWQAWHERELAWRERRWPVLLETLSAAKAGPAVEALRELGRHALYRGELARTLAANLARFPRSAALAACAELERLGSRHALPGLVAVLSDCDPKLRAAAWHALRSMTGMGLALAPELWQPVVDS